MKLLVFAVKDTKANEYGTPLFFQTKEVAVRSLSEVVNRQEDHPFYKYPQDFELFVIGEFNTENAEIKATEKTFVISLDVTKVKYEAKQGE